MAFVLRLPPDLHARAVARADDLGLSLNRFVALALDEYIRQCGDRPVLRVDPGPVPAAATAVKPAPAAAKAAPAFPRRGKRRKR
jgi:hypothetical protein